MWDLKLSLIDSVIYLNFFLYDLFFHLLDVLNPLTQSGIFFFGANTLYQFPQNNVFFFAIKFCLSIGFLILIRGGTPRYRYDYLTKLGWLKFLGFIIYIFFSTLLLMFTF